MKKSNQNTVRSISRYALLFGFSILLLACTNGTTEGKNETTQNEETKAKDIIWHIKAIHPDGKSLAIKAIDKEGNQYDVNAVQNSEQHSFLDVKAFINDKFLPVKILVSNDKFAPIKAIAEGGVSYDIKAITPEGEKLDVKGIFRSGNIVSIKAINQAGEFYGVNAVSPTGLLNDVMGIKINIKEKEMTLKGFNVFAHVKAMHQSDNEYETKALVALKKEEKLKSKSKKKNKSKSKEKKEKKENEFKNIIWNVKAITEDGRNIKVKGFDTEGDIFDVKVIQDSDQSSFMNVKAFVNGNELPIKVLVSENKYAPVKAIDGNGNLYDIKAIEDDGTILDVNGVNREGNIIDIKAINTNGDFYAIKAFSPDGKLNDIKGIKIFKRVKEMSIRGNKVYAHLKAITQ
jgi:hypothetical protein